MEFVKMRMSGPDSGADATEALETKYGCVWVQYCVLTRVTCGWKLVQWVPLRAGIQYL